MNNALPQNCKRLAGTPAIYIDPPRWSIKRPASYRPGCEQAAAKADGGPANRLLAGGILLCLLLLAACETLESRLTRNQSLLQNSPPEHQHLIQQGRIQVGFNPTEVYLAWGAPTHKSFTENARGSEETWYYTMTQTETYYREERYYDRRLDTWRYIDRPYQRYLEYIFQEAIFSNGALSSFTIYPSYKPYSGQSLR